MTLNPNSLYAMKSPQKWQAGLAAEKPFYFKCCRCDNEMIHGFQTGSDGEIALIPVENETLLVRRLLFCAEHMPGAAS